MAKDQGETDDTTSETSSSSEGAENGQGGSGSGSGLATAAAASLAAGASYMVAKRVLGNKGESGSAGSSLKNMGSKAKAAGSSGQQNGKANGNGSSSASDSLRGVLDSVTWTHAQEIAMPFAERVADAAGEFVAREAPDVVADRLIPRFIDAFNRARSND